MPLIMGGFEVPCNLQRQWSEALGTRNKITFNVLIDVMLQLYSWIFFEKETHKLLCFNSLPYIDNNQIKMDFIFYTFALRCLLN